MEGCKDPAAKPCRANQVANARACNISAFPDRASPNGVLLPDLVGAFFAYSARGFVNRGFQRLPILSRIDHVTDFVKSIYSNPKTGRSSSETRHYRILLTRAELM